MNSHSNESQPVEIQLQETYRQYFEGLAAARHADAETLVFRFPPVLAAARMLDATMMPYGSYIYKQADTVSNTILEGGRKLSGYEFTQFVSRGVRSLIYSGLAVSPAIIDIVKEGCGKSPGWLAAEIRPDPTIYQDLNISSSLEKARLRALGYGVLARSELGLKGRVGRRLAQFGCNRALKRLPMHNTEAPRLENL
jgi:hypothetical protein